MIKFNCSKCKKLLRVKEELGGKKAKCPGCQQVLIIPAPVRSTADVEELAAAAFADKPIEAPAPKQESKTIDFDCPQCGEPIRLSMDMAGKQAPCPECSRIIKVPLPVKNEPKDWRKVDTKIPTGARRDNEPAPEGAWGSAVSTGKVSRQALVEAEAIPEIKEYVSPLHWVRRGLVLTATVVGLVVGVMALLHYRDVRKQKSALTLAEDFLPPRGKKNHVPPLEAAEIYRAQGEYYLEVNKPVEAKKSLGLARAQLQTVTPSPQRDFMLIDLVLTQADLLGTLGQITSSQRLQKEKGEIIHELSSTLNLVNRPESRLEAVREIAKKLITRGDEEYAFSLANSMGDDQSAGEIPERQALIGLELHRAGKKQAEDFAARALQAYQVKPKTDKEKDKDKDKTVAAPPSPSLAALLLALNQADKITLIKVEEPPRSGVPAYESRMGFCQGWALRGDFARARTLAGAGGRADHRLQALVAVAGIIMDKNPADAKEDLTKAISALNDAQQQGTKLPPWAVLRLVRLCVQANMLEEARQAAEAIADTSFQDRAWAECYRGMAKAEPKKVMDWLMEAKQKSPVALETLARLASQEGKASAALKAIDTWTPETLKPFGYVGVALGLKDKD